MSRALAVHHGEFGRATVYHLDRDMTTHAHREGHLAFHLSGAPAHIAVEDNPVALSEDSAAAINPWQAHNFLAGDQENGSIFLILYIEPIWFLEFGHGGLSGLRFGSDQVAIDAMIRRQIMRAGNYLLEGESGDRLSGFLYELTRECFDQSWCGASESQRLRDAGRGFCDYRVRRSISIIRSRLGEEFDIDGVARDVGLSRPHFFKLFKKQTGLTPNLYANTLRMEEAIGKLTRTDKSITEIGFELSFSSQASFSRFFAQNAGISPSNYRQAALGAVR